MERGWQTVTRALRIGVVLFPMWLSYALPFVRARQLLQTVPPEVWARKHRRWARRFYALAVGMRGGLIKVGQIMSTRVDLLPPEWTEELSGLQDQVTPRPWSEVERRLEAEYEQPVSALFEHLAHEAVAAASFGQVHRGTTRDGRDVALKIKSVSYTHLRAHET